MNWNRKALIVSMALALAGGWSVARAADDMAGMNMGQDKKPAKETAAVTAKKGEKVEIAVTDKGFEPDTVTVKKGEPVELVFTRKTDKTCIKEVVLDTGAPKKIQGAASEQTGHDQDQVRQGREPQLCLQHEHVPRDRDGSVIGWPNAWRGTGGFRPARPAPAGDTAHPENRTGQQGERSERFSRAVPAEGPGPRGACIANPDRYGSQPNIHSKEQDRTIVALWTRLRRATTQ